MPIEIRGLAPLLAVFDMKASVRFYRDVLGFELVTTSAPGDDFGWALLRRGGAEVMLDAMHDTGDRPSAPDPARTAAHQDTILCFGCPDVDAAYAHLRAHGVDAEEPFVQSYGMKQLYLRDPDGYGVCLQWPASAETLGQWREWYGLESADAADPASTVDGRQATRSTSPDPRARSPAKSSPRVVDAQTSNTL